MNTQKLKFYPVANGDTFLATLSDGQFFMVDCKIDNNAADDKEKFDVKKDLISLLPQDEEGRHHLDAFVLSHPDQDHCSGFKDTFFCDDPKNYDKNAEERNAIIIDELWFSDTLFDRFKNPLSDAAKNFKKEAKRRKDLYLSDPEQAKKPGNRLILIAFKDECKGEGFDDIIVEPGTETKSVNHKNKSDFSVFVHSPFKTPTKDSQDRNETSVIMQLRFGSDDDPMAALAFAAGDADYNRFERLIEERDDESIEWDLFLAPHHCSWTYFNMTPQKEYPNPQPCSLDYLDRQRGAGIIIASSKKIVDNEDNPPHYKAKQQYLKKIKEANFYNTADTPLEPIEFEASKNGFSKVNSKATSNNKAKALGAVTSAPKTYG